MTHVIFDLCVRDGACVEVCPVECIIPGEPESDWPWYYIDPETCIDCGACVPECPPEAILPEEELEEQKRDVWVVPQEILDGMSEEVREMNEALMDEDGAVSTLALNTLFFTEDGPGYPDDR